MEDNVVKVAQIMGKWVGGGVESVIMNYYKNIDISKVKFDFIFDSDSIYIPQKEIESLGGNVFIIPPYQHVLKYQKALKKIFKDNQYDIVHSNINALSVIPLRVAKKCKVPIRIAHSHSTTVKIEIAKNILKQLFRPFSKVYATEYFACSEIAGRWLFGNKAFDEGKVVIVNNGIEVESYLFNEEIRKEKRKELNIKDTDIVVGHIGRFVKQKNHEFLIDVFSELYKKNNNYKLMLIGQGPLQEEMKHKVKELEIENAVMFLGQKTDANKYYQAMDLFLFPSLYEGLGMVLIEAQTSGLPCIASIHVPEIAKVTDDFEFLSIENNRENIMAWCDTILRMSKTSYRKNNEELIRANGYDIKNEAINLQNKYIELVKKHKE